jgi:S-adenosyl-L-methionine hydrolase (adenosine-forming)
MTSNGGRIVAWITDFGCSDGYVAAMKATALAIQSNLIMVDITHEIPPGDIDQAAFVLSQCYEFFPEQTIFVCVVDPGVGSERKIILADSEQHIFIAPDNGLLKFIFSREARVVVRCLDIDKVMRRPCSTTFHGRDIMAPAAAMLAQGIATATISSSVDYYDRGGIVLPVRLDAAIQGRIIHIDHFGNCISNIPGSWLSPGNVTIRIGSLTDMTLQCRYGDVRSGEPVWLIGSHDYLELAVRDGNAAERYRIGRGTTVTVNTGRQS